MINYLSKFTSDLAEVASPLCCLLAKDVEFAWDESQANAFQQIKEILTRSPGPVLSYYDMTTPLILQADASKFGLGTILLQENKSNFSQIEKMFQYSLIVNAFMKTFIDAKSTCKVIICQSFL